MLRTSVGGTVSYTVYAFGLEEHQYNASGTNTGNTSYYSVGGHLIGEQTGTSTKTTTFLLTDLLGSVVASFSNTSGSATVQGNRAYSPYGTPLYQQGSVGTSKGFTGQYADSTSGLDDDNARYYDPLVGQFVSADSVQANLQRMDSSASVGGNPETSNDPSGQCLWCVVGVMSVRSLVPPVTTGCRSPITTSMATATRGRGRSTGSKPAVRCQPEQSLVVRWSRPPQPLQRQEQRSVWRQ
jgi:RHS repeat-associated protein